MLALLALLAAAMLALAGSAQANTVLAGETAPTCPTSPLTEQTKMARAVFTGIVDAVEREPATDDGSVEYLATLSVDRVYKPGGGSLITSTTVEVRTDSRPGRCSLGPLAEGQRYLVFAGVDDEQLVATGESGTAPADPEVIQQLEGLLGPGRPPVDPDPPTASFTAVDTSAPVPLARAVAPGAVAVLVGLLGLALVRRVGR